MGVGEAVVYFRELYLVFKKSESLFREVLKSLGCFVVVTPEIYVPDIVFDLSGSQEIVVFEKYVAGGESTFNCFIVTAERRESDQLTYLRSCGHVSFVKGNKPGSGVIEMFDGLKHLSVNQAIEHLD